mmetsp:Transcript_23219/g.17654  ORF Transcript_23219/g.17654 Transcript_23219/m.17654 type:complete len:183 (+) Transcript_23219:518-1066(+)
MLVEFKLQISKKKNFAELKKRVADCLSARFGQKVETDQIRMWRFAEKNEVLIERCQKLSLPDPEHQKKLSEQNNPDLEINSGVEFPGDSVEPLIGTSTVMEDETFEEAKLVIEFRLNPNSGFAFAFLKNQRVFVGKCEFCNQKKILMILCACKRVRYCSDRCLEKDKSFHYNDCSAKLDAEL